MIKKYFLNLNVNLLCLLVLLFSGCAHEILLPGDKNDPQLKRLTLIHFNDGESHLLNAGAGLEDYGGIARFATIIKNIREEIQSDLSTNACLTVSAGDNFLAGPVFNVSIKKGVPYYDAVALDNIGVDVFALGNHDFDFGPDILASFIESFNLRKPVFLSANLNFSNEPRLLKLQEAGKIAGAVILEKGGQKFGLIGLTTPELKMISSPRNVMVNKDIAKILQRAIDKLNRAGVNKIILISHFQGIKHDIELIKQTKGIDIVVAGGGGELLVNKDQRNILDGLKNDKEITGPYPMFVKDADLRNVPLVTTPGDYCYVGRLDLLFDSKGEVAHVSVQSGPIRVVGDGFNDAVEPDRLINEKVVIPLAKAISTSSNIVGVAKVLLDGERDHVRSRETNLGNLVADSVFWNASKEANKFKADKPTVAMINAGSIRASIPAGQISDAMLFATCPFYDFITIVEDVPPDVFKGILESAVSAISDDGSLSGDTGKFPQLSNMSIVYNPKRNPGKRIKQIKLNNGDFIVNNYKIVQYAPYVNIATLNFLARGGDDWNFGKSKKINLGVSIQNSVINFISESNKIGGLNKLILKKYYPKDGNNRIMITRE